MLNSNAEPSRDNEPSDGSGSSYRCEVRGTRHVVLVVVAVCRVRDPLVVAAPGGTGDDRAFLFLLLWKWATLPAIHPTVIVNPTTSYCPLVVLKMCTERGLLTCCASVLVCSK